MLRKARNNLLDGAADSAHVALEATQHALTAARDGSQRILARVSRTSGRAAAHIGDNPVWSALTAAAAGAALVAVLTLLTRWRSRQGK